MRTVFLVLCLFGVIAAPVWALPEKGQQSFATLEGAVSKLVTAMSAKDRKALVSVLGVSTRELVVGLEPPHLAYLRQQIERSHSFRNKSPEEVELVFGADGQRFPFVLRMGESGWFFEIDPNSGGKGIWNRELVAAHVCRAYVEAQRKYFRIDRNGDGVPEFSLRFRSSPGYEDGLYWEETAENPINPLGFLFGKAKAERVDVERPASRMIGYHGYHYRILAGQGAAARDGARSYMVNGKMTAGFALLAWPAQWGVSGRKSFMINHDEVLYAKDLGKETSRIASSLAVYDPGEGWHRLGE